MSSASRKQVLSLTEKSASRVRQLLEQRQHLFLKLGIKSAATGYPTPSVMQVLTAIGNFCICTIAVGMLIGIIVMYPIQHRYYRSGINNLLVFLIGGIPIAMPTVLSVTMAIGSHRLSQQEAITKRMTSIEEIAGMDKSLVDVLAR